MLGSTSSINNYANIFGIQSGQSVEQLAKTFAATAQQKMPTDSVTISSSAAMLQQFLNTEMQGGGSATADIGELDLVGLAQLKQRGEMLANMLQLKLKNFESNLTATMKGAGLPMQNMDFKNGDEGMMLLGEMPNKETIQNALGGLSGEFTDIARFAEVLNMLQQLGPDNVTKELSGLAGLSSAAHYVQQSVPDRSKRPESDFLLHVTPTGSSFTFE